MASRANSDGRMLPPRMQLESPSIASKNWVYRQYDYTVRNGTVIQPGSDAAVIRLKKDSVPELPEDAPNRSAEVVEKYVAMSVDGNGSYVYPDPYEGGKTVHVEAARNLARSGAVPWEPRIISILAIRITQNFFCS